MGPQGIITTAHGAKCHQIRAHYQGKEDIYVTSLLADPLALTQIEQSSLWGNTHPSQVIRGWR